MPTPPYIGRFAPSPSGRLHLGSLTCALASYLDARQHHGRWLLRIEDLDPPREQAGATQDIIACLTLHELRSDGEIWLQSQRSQAYQDYLARLWQTELLYSCNCNRQRLATLGGRYDGFCRQHPATGPSALRLKTELAPPQLQFNDRHLGPQQADLCSSGDFIVHRKDGLFAYQLAVVVDDIAQGITHVVRGNDILEATARQIYLFNLLGAPPPLYCHIPLISDLQGQKLSKQNRAPELNLQTPGTNLWLALRGLGATPPPAMRYASPKSLIDWALVHWSLAQLPQQLNIAADSLSGTLN